MDRPTAFVVVTVVVLVVAAIGAVGIPENDTETGADEVTANADVPDLDSVDAPTETGIATVDGTEYASVRRALEAAEPGDTVFLSGRFDEDVTVKTPAVTLAADGPEAAMIDGSGDGDVLTIDAPDVTVDSVWIRNSGSNADTEDAGVFVDGADTTLQSVRLTDVTFGVWVDGVDRVTIAESTIVGREDVRSHAERGNGIHLWETEDTVIRGNDITRVRDGIYFSWAEAVEAADNRLWDLRYGVHYMYSNDNRLVDNLAVDNDVGYALMVSENLELIDNTAIGNRGQSGHGILLKDIETTTLRGNVLADNEQGFYISNSQDSRLDSNLVLENDVGIHSTAGSSGQAVIQNSFIHNDVQAFTTRDAVVAWNGTDTGNYWSDARTVDRTGDGISETRHRPAGAVEQLVHDQPEAAVFADSPAFSAVRLAEDSFPAMESPGIVDHRPLTDSPHDWQQYKPNGETNGNQSD